MRVLRVAGIFLAAPWLLSGQAPPSTNRSHSFGPDACAPADSAYIHAANETGGIPLFLQRSEAGKAFHLVRESTRSNVATVFWASAALDGKPQTIEIPVDSVTKRITFSFSVDTKGSALKLTQPSGRTIADNLPGAEITELNCGRIVTISSPEAGQWQAEITGTGRYWLQAQAQSDIYFVSVEFVKNGGRPGHEGLFGIQGQPVAGLAATLHASVSARAVRTAELYLATEQGYVLQKLQLHKVNSYPESLEFVGSVDLPTVPFRVAVAGLDSSGNQYQRFFSSLFHAETVEVSGHPDIDAPSPGSTKQLTFAVRNIGSSRMFNITVFDAHKFVTNVEPKELLLGAGESGTVRVELTVPPGTPPGLGDDVVLVATSASAPATSNFTVAHFYIGTSAGAPTDLR
jgi:von Willebrand factor A domain-containing protein 7